MTARFSRRLEGLEPENFLAFMALIGLMRALEVARPNWRPRAFWNIGRNPLRPAISLVEDISEEAIAEAVAEGVQVCAKHHEFDNRSAIDFPLDVSETGLSDANAQRRRVFECLLTPGAYKEDGTPMPTPYCLMFGQGHQHFLQRFAEVPNLAEPPARGSSRRPEPVSAAASIVEACFRQWRRVDLTDSFRWDPDEANRYALRARNPSSDKDAKTTQHGANRLAAIALPMLPAFAVARRGAAKTLAVGAYFSKAGQVEFSWPIWTVPASLNAIKYMLACLVAPSESKLVEAMRASLGIAYLMRASRISLGKFMNVSAAIAEPLI